MTEKPPSARPLRTGGESGGGAYSGDIQDKTPHDGDFAGGQSIKSYHGSVEGGEANAATQPNPDRKIDEESEDHG